MQGDVDNKEVFVKTGSVSLNGAFIKQNKSMNENRPAEKKTTKSGAGIKVDISTKAPPAPSYEEALELIRGIDFAQLRNTNWVSKNTATQLAQLLQA